MDPILMTTQAAGIVLLLGMMFLLFFRRVVLDAETKTATSFKLPFLGEMTTQSPVLVLVLIGAVMVVYPLSTRAPSTVTVSGTVDPGSASVAVLVIADPDYSHSYDAAGNFKFEFPLLNSKATYRVKFVANKQIIDDQEVNMQHGPVVLREVSYVPKIGDDTTAITPRKDISDEQLKKLGIGN
jgi:hypothetical protein